MACRSLICCLAFVAFRCTYGHVYLFEPPSRNVISHRNGEENCPHCLQANGPDAVKARGRNVWPTKNDPSSHGLCGDPVQNSAEPMSISDMKYMTAGPSQRTYVAGSVVEFKVGVSTHHWGHYEFRICDRVLDRNLESAEAGQQCLNTWVLKRAPRSPSCGESFEGDCQRNNPQHPERWYLPPPGRATSGGPVDPNNEVHTMRFVIPEDLRCDHCTLQWYYATGNTCAYDADYLDFDPGFKFWLHYQASWATCDNSCCGPQASGLWAEEFWNCADIQVLAKGETTPQVTLTSTSAPSSTTTVQGTSTTTSDPTGNPTTTKMPPLESPVARHGNLHTSGNQIIDQHGQVVQLRGMSLFWSQWSEGSKYYNHNAVQWLRDDWHVNLVRIAMGVQHGGFLDNPDVERARVKAVVDATIELGIYVIIDWHDHHAEQHITEAKAFFEDVAATYGKSPNVIFETFNEPIHQSWGSVIKPYHQEIVSVIRKHSDNLIVLGSRTWSQDVDEASLDPVDGINLAYTLHFYANTHRDSLRQKASTALANGIPLFVTEWGTCSADGNGALDLESTQVWLDFLKQHSISDANWAISDKDEKCAALRPGSDAAGNWPNSHLTASGSFMRTSIRDFARRDDSSTTTTTRLSQVSSTSTSLRSTSTVGVSSTTTSTSTLPTTSSPSSTSLRTTSSGVSRTTTSTSTLQTTTSPSSGNCDQTCVDIKEANECQNADIQWSMCASSNVWWHGQCQASCSKCPSGLPPCTAPPTDCDPACFDTKPVAECQDADNVWGMCTGSDSWWKRQCVAFCRLCTTELPPCTETFHQASKSQQISLQQSTRHETTATAANARAELVSPTEELSVTSGTQQSFPFHCFAFFCIAYMVCLHVLQ
jgi:endoglucanase